MIFPEALETYFEMYMFRVNNINDEPRERSREYHQTIFMDAYDFRYCELQERVQTDYVNYDTIEAKAAAIQNERDAYKGVSIEEILSDLNYCLTIIRKELMTDFIIKEIVLSAELHDCLGDIKQEYLKYKVVK